MALNIEITWDEPVTIGLLEQFMNCKVEQELRCLVRRDG
ncbi:hypothetical protein EDD90_10607 [Streptomyces sp. Ag109_O5-1]|nr:hypothetical protein EDD90_10607 [Streptomyces sp. Ag109_O5-1]